MFKRYIFVCLLPGCFLGGSDAVYAKPSKAAVEYAITWKTVSVPEKHLSFKVPSCFDLKQENDGSEVYWRTTAQYGCLSILNNLEIRASQEDKKNSTKVGSIKQIDLSKKADLAVYRDCISAPKPKMGSAVVSRDCGGATDRNEFRLEFSFNCAGRRFNFETRRDEKFNGKKEIKVDELKDKNLRKIIESIECHSTDHL